MARTVYQLKRCDCDCATQENPCECEPLECPPYTKLMLPLLTESSGIWFEDSAAAAAILASRVSNCVGYLNRDPAAYSDLTWGATDGGGSLELSAEATDDEDHDVGTVTMAGSVNIATSGPLSVAWAYAASGGGDPMLPKLRIRVYNSAGTLVASLEHDLESDSESDVFTTSTLAAGRYLVTVAVESRYSIGVEPTAGYGFEATITSTSTLTVNPAQAVFDDGETCPGLLDCE